VHAQLVQRAAQPVEKRVEPFPGLLVRRAAIHYHIHGQIALVAIDDLQHRGEPGIVRIP